MRVERSVPFGACLGSAWRDDEGGFEFKGVRHRCGDAALFTMQFEEMCKVKAEKNSKKKGKRTRMGVKLR